MELYLDTANGPQRSRCGEIGSPEGEKMPEYLENVFVVISSNIRIIF
jgi:hypothetical protein